MDSSLSDFDSFSESSSSEDQEDMESLYGGHARSIFSSLEETIEKIDDFLMFERVFSHGDIVCLVEDPLGKIGKVINVDMAVDLENIHGTKTRGVSSKYLRKIRSVSIGDYVVFGGWLGKVEKTVDIVTVMLDDGTRCQITTDGPDRITALSPDVFEDPQCPFYPGRRVRVESCGLKSPGWLCGFRKDKQEQGIVCNVDAGAVYVDWIMSVSPGEKKELRPPCLQSLNSLSTLPCCPQANWQLGDMCVLPEKPCLPGDYAAGQVERHSVSPVFQEIGVIVKTKTKIDVQWQDGSESLGLDSHLLCPVNIVDAHDFWPNAFVMEKGTTDDSSFRKWGVVASVDPKERTVEVKWCDGVDQAEIVSAYELVEHPDYSYSLGEKVFRTEKSIIDLVDGKGVEYNGEELVRFNDKFLSCFGTVVGFKDRDVEVKWATGAISKVAPYEIYRVDKCEGDDESAQSSTEELLVKNQGQKLKDVLGFNYDNAKESSSNSIAQAAINIVTSMTSSLFGSMGIFSGYSCTEDQRIHGKSEEALELCDLNLGSQVRALDELEIASLHSNEAYEDSVFPSGSKDPESFRQFDIVNDCSDHHFVDESGMSQVKRSWLKKVNQEWSVLQKDLPESIYVRVYEERMDLVRAAIVGTEGTPYHNGLFFFDIYLPPQYPNEPPMVHYNSGGLRINPNLYESGKVCLSLLNTWAGSGSEVWNPESSTILQVLVSLQALVLNDKPYFNEAGYDTQMGKAEGEKNSFTYNENAFLLNCRSMIYVLRKSPKHFEALVDEHFRRCCRSILLGCKKYMGDPFSSTGFKIMLTKLYSKLVEALSEKGIDCNDLLDMNEAYM